MKIFVLTTVLFFNCFICFGADYTKIDLQSRSLSENLKTIDGISNYLTQNLYTPQEKSRAIFYWITHNIKYNDDILNTSSNRFDRKKILEEVLRNRQGVCQHFAELFQACCESVGVKSYVISGYTHQEYQLDSYSHAWNAIEIDDEFYLVDASWAATLVQSKLDDNSLYNSYFLATPAVFIKTHMPFDPIWQFLNNPISNKEFVFHDYSKLKIKSYYNFGDSILILPSMGVLDKMIREENRIIGCGVTNKLVQDRVLLNEKNIQLQSYNAAVDEFNKGVEIYNAYLDSKYKQFRNVKSDENKIRNMLRTSMTQVEQSEKLLQELNPREKDIIKMMLNMQSAIKIQKKKLTKENDFVTRYFNTWEPIRILID